MNRTLFIFLLILAGGCDSTTVNPFQIETPSEILGGNLDTDRAAVGALVVFPSGAPFCTGTLISPTHVLTAAHCVFSREKEAMEFFLGNTLSSPDGQRIGVSDIAVHPEFDPMLYINDAAVLTLDETINDVAPMLLSSRNDEDTLLNDTALYSGFGRTESGTSGTRYAAEVPFYSLYRAMFTAVYDDTDDRGICFGDSGGPALHDFGSGFEVIGVNSTVLAYNEEVDPCAGTYSITRITPLLPFINDIIEAPTENCRELAGLCLCNNACQPEGTCDNDLCRTKNCAAGFDCLSACPLEDGACANGCYLSTTEEDLTLLTTFLKCGSTHCGTESEEAIVACLETYCPDEMNGCFDEPACDSNIAFCDTDSESADTDEIDLPQAVSGGCQISPVRNSSKRSILNLLFF